MLIATRTVLAAHTGGRLKKGDPVLVGTYSCDHCCIEFEKRISQMSGKSNHFCSRRCTYAERNKHGLIGQTRRQTTVVRYGVENVFQSAETQVKSRETMQLRYGVDQPMDIPEVRQKIVEANITRWKNMTSEDRLTLQTKKKATSLERYGFEHPMKAAHVRQRATQSMLVGGFLRSKGERFLESMLVSLFGQHDVMIQVWQNDVAGRNHPVDMYVKSLRLMIEFDGFWHHRHDVQQRDEEFNAWCSARGRKLLRISEDDLCNVALHHKTRLPVRERQRELLRTDTTLNRLRQLVELAASSDQYVIRSIDLVHKITMPPTTASCVKFEPNV